MELNIKTPDMDVTVNIQPKKDTPSRDDLTQRLIGQHKHQRPNEYVEEETFSTKEEADQWYQEYSQWMI